MYKRIELPYSYDALEPHMDAETVKLHYELHHKGYEDKLNKAIELKGYESKVPTSLLELCKGYLRLPDEGLRIAAREFGGGLINHNFWWQLLKPNVEMKESVLKGEIIKTWGSVENFKAVFEKEAMSLFGSGWVWLVKRRNGSLKIVKTFNQDNPWFLGFYPILGVDLWEHSYYLKHKGSRKTYLESFWNLVNWDFCSEEYDKEYKR